MNLNQEAHFAASPLGIGIKRSKFDRSNSWTYSFNAGQLNCCYWDFVLPGDTKKMHVKALLRMTTPLAPVMDDAYLDEWAFFVPWRLVWEHVEEFFGANNESYWIQPQEYTIPMIDVTTTAAKAARKVSDLADQIGIPFWNGTDGTPITDGDVNALIFRSYRLIWNEYFRDENTQSPKLVSTGDTETDETLLDTLPVNRIHDYFGSCLPGTQKHEAVKIAITGLAPVVSIDRSNKYKLGDILAGDILTGPTVSPLTWNRLDTGAAYEPATNAHLSIHASDGGTQPFAISGTSDSGLRLGPRNLYANLNASFDPDYDTGTGIDINELRAKVAAQRIYEAMSISGSRFTEWLQAIWSITSPDARLQRPELLGHYRRRISMSEVAQSTPQLPDGESVTTPLGTVGAFSKTYSDGLYFEKSFTEYGFCLILFSIRTARSYCQGINSQLRAKTMLDIYNPKLAFIGEQPVYTDEIYAGADKDDIFGYQEAWASYRFKPNLVGGYCSTAVPLSIAHEWTYADKYNRTPVLSSQWMEEGDDRIKRSLAVQYIDAEHQIPAHDFVGQFVCECDDVRPMPLYSVPGLMDHF